MEVLHTQNFQRFGFHSKHADLRILGVILSFWGQLFRTLADMTMTRLLHASEMTDSTAQYCCYLLLLVLPYRKQHHPRCQVTILLISFLLLCFELAVVATASAAACSCCYMVLMSGLIILSLVG